jgi:F-type H+-transporting ATPase subunit delta
MADCDAACKRRNQPAPPCCTTVAPVLIERPNSGGGTRSFSKKSVIGSRVARRAPTGQGPAWEKTGQVAETTRVSTVAERYANALFELALDGNQFAAVETDLANFASLIKDSADLKRLVTSPVFSAEEQTRAITSILDRAGIGGLVANLVKVAAGNRRLFVVPEVITAFRQRVARHRGEVSAEVTSAEPLSAKHLAALKEALKAALGKDVALDTNVDPGLIGGLIVKVGSRMLDGSLRTKLNSMKLAMKEVG